MKPNVQAFFDPATSTVSYVVFAADGVLTRLPAGGAY